MDLYGILGIKDSATEDEIKKAYKKWISDNHPDKNPDDKSLPDKIKQVNMAYATLGDPEKRRAYDLKNQMHQNSIFEDILRPFGSSFREVFRRETSLNIPGDDVFTSVRISLEDSFRGVKVPVDTNEVVVCSFCSGTGGKPGVKQVICGSCAGLGYTEDPFSVSRSVCLSCQGRKTRPLSNCDKCHGVGKTTAKKSILVSIPAGVKNEDKLRIPNKGKPGTPPGDLYLNVLVQELPGVFRMNDDLVMDTKVPIKYLLFGGQISVKTPWNHEYTVVINHETDPGSRHIVRSAGFRNSDSVGDLICILNPSLPKIRSERHKELLTELLDQIETSSDSTTKT